jgi:hypothetical protein
MVMVMVIVMVMVMVVGVMLGVIVVVMGMTVTAVIVAIKGLAGGWCVLSSWRVTDNQCGIGLIHNGRQCYHTNGPERVRGWLHVRRWCEGRTKHHRWTLVSGLDGIEGTTGRVHGAIHVVVMVVGVMLGVMVVVMVMTVMAVIVAIKGLAGGCCVLSSWHVTDNQCGIGFIHNGQQCCHTNGRERV